MLTVRDVYEVIDAFAPFATLGVTFTLCVVIFGLGRTSTFTFKSTLIVVR